MADLVSLQEKIDLRKLGHVFDKQVPAEKALLLVDMSEMMVSKLSVEHVSVTAFASESTNSALLSIIIVVLVFILVVFRIAIVNDLLVVH